ncbi:MAG: hypothetical protein WAM14_09725 [Candidatus Nitrosopolaris sp.]
MAKTKRCECCGLKETLKEPTYCWRCLGEADREVFHEKILKESNSYETRLEIYIRANDIKNKLKDTDMYDCDNGIWLPTGLKMTRWQENKRPEIHEKVLAIVHDFARLKILKNEISKDPLFVSELQRLREKK